MVEGWDGALSGFGAVGGEGLPEAAAALKRIARDEGIKAYAQNEKPVHDALLGAALRFIGGERLDGCLEVAARLNGRGHAATSDYMGESPRDEATAREATEEFLRVVRAIHERELDSSGSTSASGGSPYPIGNHDSVRKLGPHSLRVARTFCLHAALQAACRVRVHPGGQGLGCPSGAFEQHDALVRTRFSFPTRFGMDDLESVALLQGRWQLQDAGERRTTGHHYVAGAALAHLF